MVAQTASGPNGGAAAGSNTPTTTTGPDAHLPPTNAKLNGLAHRLLQAGLKTNALADENLAPWHIKIDYQMRNDPSPKLVSGSVEEWHAGPYQWRRTYTSSDEGATGTEWSTSRTERFTSKRGMRPQGYHFLLLRVTRPVIEPLYQAANVKPDYEMKAVRTTTEGVTLNCASVVDGARYTDEPDFIFATTCFDTDLHLRLTVAGDTTVQFDDVQMFQGKAVARNVKVIQQGRLLAEMKVSALEALPAGSEAEVKPPVGAVPEPYVVESGMPKPESVYEVAASLGMAPTFPYRGAIPVPIVILKDGSVKVQRGQLAVFSTQLGDALENAINKWKYKPYHVDGQPVEVAQTVFYPIDGKPFVPSYDRPKPKAVLTAPEDFSSAYDPKRDPAKDLAAAQAQAAAGHKRILMEVGGDWCSWCKILDKFFLEHADVRSARDAEFVLLKVNFSGNNENVAFLSQYPAIPGYPWIFVLDGDGKLLKSVDTNTLESGNTGYSEKAIRDFLTAWKR
ncbi:thioredoxin family protein [Occallatibacter riparius]|uniref:Thioredoxin family protein n=1 Tax=Occallatibacter riparius TaxID=1002689 RepID=A0A9J7BJK2_9BACT|nr:thioredoxin family protein [Occallatibacter riparius]UWZ82715.1 thioredoxin family protein [Occallatibacter riparius]